MPKILLLFLCLVSLQPLSANGDDNNNLCVSLNTGYGAYLSFDKLLNHSTYKGYSGFPIRLESLLIRNKNLFAIDINTNWARLNLENGHNLYYEYNYIKQQQGELSIEYMRKLVQLKEKLFINVGVAYHFNFVMQQEYYKSMLYDYASGFRKSYSISVLDLSPVIMFSYRINTKNILHIKAYYTPFSFSARPNDNFVKQLGLSDGRAQWRFFSFKEYEAMYFAITYKRTIIRNLDIECGFNMQYVTYSYPDECSYVQNQLLVGIAKIF